MRWILCTCGFDLFPRPVLAHEGGVDLVVEVADVLHTTARFFSALSMPASQTLTLPVVVTIRSILPAGRVDAGLGAVVDAVLVRGNQLEAVHAGLHGADRVDLGDLDDHAFLTQDWAEPLPTSP